MRLALLNEVKKRAKVELIRLGRSRRKTCKIEVH